MTNDYHKIKVLEVIQQGEIGGGESHLLTLLDNMDKQHFEPVVIALSNGEMISRLQKMSIPAYVVKSKLPFNPSIWAHMKKITEQHRIDVIHTHGARSLSNIFKPASALQIPIVHTVHGWSFHDYLPSWKRRLRIFGENYLSKKTTINIVVSDSNRKVGEEKLDNYRCTVVNNGVDLSLFERKEKSPVRQEFGIPDNAILISFVARFIHDKNPLPLIKAFHAVSKEFPAVRMIMAGNGPARDEAIGLAETLGISDKIVFPGFRSDVPDILSSSDIFCLPSIKEGLPVSLIEAMAMGNAPIATNVQGCVDVITDQVDGLLVDINNLEKTLTAALRKLIAEPAVLKNLAVAARKTVEQKFDAVKMTRTIEDLYREAIAVKFSKTPKPAFK